MLQRDPVVFAADGFDLTHEWEGVNERVDSRIAKRPVVFRRRSHGGIGTPIISLPAESKSAATKINHRNRYGSRRR
jgi:hypothetical protein